MDRPYEIQCLQIDNIDAIKIIPKGILKPQNIADILTDIEPCVRTNNIIISGRLPLFIVVAIASWAAEREVNICFADPKLKAAVCPTGNTIQLPKEVF